jgi:hypothetical protein
MQVQTAVPALGANAVFSAPHTQTVSTQTAPAPAPQSAKPVQAALPAETTVPASPAPRIPEAETPSAPTAAPAMSPTVADSAVADPDEKLLNSEIGQLWRTHSEAQSSLRMSREEVKRIRADLSRHLHELKSILSRPGRGGAWFSFLKAQAIPRSTADRMVNAHEKTISQEAGNCPTGASEKHEPMEVVVHRYLNGLWPKLSRVLTTREHVEMFIAALTNIAEKSFAAADESSNSPGSEDPSPDPPHRVGREADVVRREH